MGIKKLPYFILCHTNDNYIFIFTKGDLVWQIIKGNAVGYTI